MSALLPWRALAPALTPVPPSRLLRDMREASPASIDGLHTAIRQTLQLPEVVLCDSGTSALRMALEQLAGAGPVALPAFGCFDLATAAIGAGVSVRCYDVDPDTLTPDLDSVAAVLAQGVTALVVAGVYGYPPPMPAIRALCDAAGVALVEDVAQGTGALWDGQPLGRWGDAAVLSFGRGKGLGGAGGGACAFRTVHAVPPLLASAAPMAGLRGGLTLLLQQLLAHPALYAIPESLPWLQLGETHYHAPWAPRAMHPLQAQLAWDGLRHATDACAARTAVADLVIRAFAHERSDACRIVRSHAVGTAGYLRLAVRGAPTTLSIRRPLPKVLVRMGARPVYPLPLPDLPALRPWLVDTDRRAWRGAEEIVQRMITVPTHQHVTPTDGQTIARVLTGRA